MPKYNKTKYYRDNKEAQGIRTRLVELSLKVEESIYNEKPISEADAEKFISEISSYKNECCQDVPSMQVIDRLTRCLKAIILEHQGIHYNINTYYKEPKSNNVCRSSSPVYSLPDEDRTQFTPDDVRPYFDPSTTVQVHDNSNKITTEIPTNNDTSVIRPYFNSSITVQVHDNSNKIATEIPTNNDTLAVRPCRNSSNTVQSHDNSSKITTELPINNDTPDVRPSCNSSTAVQFHDNASKITTVKPTNNDTGNDDTSNIIVLVDNDKENCSNNSGIVVRKEKEITIANNVAHIHKTFSNLSLRGNDDNEMCIDVEASQSILNNYQEVDVLPLNENNSASGNLAKDIKHSKNLIPTGKENTTKYSQKIAAPPKPIILYKTNNFVPMILKKKINIQKQLVMKVTNALNKTNYFKDPVNYINQGDTQNFINNKDIFNTTTTKKANKLTLTPIVYDNITDQNINNETNISQKEPLRNHKDIKKDTAKLNKNSRTKAKESVPAKKKRNNPKKEHIENKPKKLKHKVTSDNRNDDTNLSNKTEPLRNNIVQNNFFEKTPSTVDNKDEATDLSWLEDIKFVRQIDPDEYSFMDLGENFWNNFDLPPNFDENDFV